MVRNFVAFCLVFALWGCSPDAPAPKTNDTPKKGEEKETPAKTSATQGNQADESTKEQVAAKPADKAESKPVADKPNEDMPAKDEAKPSVEEKQIADDTPAKKEVVPEDKPATEEKPEGSGTPTTAKNEEPEDEGPKNLDELIASLRKLKGQPDLDKLGDQFEKLLGKEPEHLDGLMTFMQIEFQRGSAAGSTEKGGVHFLKAAESLRKVFKLNEELANNPGVRNFGAQVYYNAACALSVEKKYADAMPVLKEAVAFGFSDFGHINKDTDLAGLRETPEWAEFETSAKEAIKVANQKEVAALLASNEPFEFNFELEDTHGKAISKAGFAGKVMIVDIWGTWCPPCRAEIPHFVELDKNFKEKGLQIVGLNRENVKGEAAHNLVNEFCEKNGVTYPCAMITEEVMAQVPDFQGFPTTLFIDKSGKVRMKVVGARGPEFLQAAVETLLAEAGPEPAAATTPAEPAAKPAEPATETPAAEPATEKPAANE